MEAQVARAYAPMFFVLMASLASPLNSFAASHRTPNFIVTAHTKALAVEIAEAAERYRSQLAIEWLGHELPNWPQPCPVEANVDPRLGAGGATSFMFETSERHYGRPVTPGDGLFRARPQGRPFGWEMSLQGSRERVLDSVLPHEVTHTIFATHFGRPLPRWADEGACTTVEHSSEKSKQHNLLYEFLKSNRGIAFNRMFAMTEYPADILPLYSQGYSVARFLIAQGGKQKFVQYIGDGLDTNDWTTTTHRHYGFESLSDLQVTWLDWVRHGSREIPARPTGLPEFEPSSSAPEHAAELLAVNTTNASSTTSHPAAGSFSLAQQPSTPARATSAPAQPVASSGAQADHSTSFASSHSATGGSTGVRHWPPRSDQPRFVPAENQNSWYVQQSRAALTKPEASQPNGTLTPPTSTRLASRPEQASRQRKVLLEWGEPSPFLNPTLPVKRSVAIPNQDVP